MVFNVLLYTSLGIFVLGLLYKISTWFTWKVGLLSEDITTATRFFAALKGILGVIFSAKILTVVKVFILDVLCERRILKEDALRWLMHMLIFYGFMLLLLMHALDKFVSEPLFSNFYPTVNPFMFLRDLFGLLVIAGVAIAMYRRLIMKIPRLKTSSMDHYAIIIVAVIMISGILLEGTKIMSHKVFSDMVDQYGDLEDEDEIQALESFWVSGFGVVSPNVKAPFDSEVLAQGEEIHENACADCHSKPQWAFTGYASAKVLSPMALALDKINSPLILWYIHIIACFLGLAYLPFSKMFHIIASPLSLIANAVMDLEKSDPANIASRQIMELDACTHCGTCTTRCSVGVTYELFNNARILPSEKIAAIKALASGKELGEQEIRHLQEGVYLCTNCHRCTDVCPVGINLQELWFNVRETLLKKGYPEFLTLTPFSYYRGINIGRMTEAQYLLPRKTAKGAIEDACRQIDAEGGVVSPTKWGDRAKKKLNITSEADTFSYCFSCTTCSTVCPVATNYGNDLEILGMVPHQMMQAVILGTPELVYRSGMLWDCLGCYECQQHCPQGVRIADIFYALKNLVIDEITEKRSS
jgi:heterodisulfide reductase subunit C/nitrate reductase gamma subunit